MKTILLTVFVLLVIHTSAAPLNFIKTIGEVSLGNPPAFFAKLEKILDLVLQNAQKIVDIDCKNKTLEKTINGTTHLINSTICSGKSNTSSITYQVLTSGGAKPMQIKTQHTSENTKLESSTVTKTPTNKPVTTTTTTQTVTNP